MIRYAKSNLPQDTFNNIKIIKEQAKQKHKSDNFFTITLYTATNIN